MVLQIALSGPRRSRGRSSPYTGPKRMPSSHQRSSMAVEDREEERARAIASATPMHDAETQSSPNRKNASDRDEDEKDRPDPGAALEERPARCRRTSLRVAVARVAHLVALERRAPPRHRRSRASRRSGDPRGSRARERPSPSRSSRSARRERWCASRGSGARGRARNSRARRGRATAARWRRPAAARPRASARSRGCRSGRARPSRSGSRSEAPCARPVYSKESLADLGVRPECRRTSVVSQKR